MDGATNALIRTASTDVATHQLADFLDGPCPALRNQTDGGADLPRRAVAALERVVIDERLLQRMERTVGGKTLDRDNPATGGSIRAIECLARSPDGAPASRA